MGKAVLKVIKNGILLDMPALSNYPKSLGLSTVSEGLLNPDKGTIHLLKPAPSTVSSVLESVLLHWLGKV